MVDFNQHSKNYFPPIVNYHLYCSFNEIIFYTIDPMLYTGKGRTSPLFCAQHRKPAF